MINEKHMAYEEAHAVAEVKYNYKITATKIEKLSGSP